MKLAIATGRPREEARHALERFRIADLFAAVVTHDDVVEANARGKPDPWPLQEAARRIGVVDGCAYIGDTPDDMRAAVSAGFVPIGVGDDALVTYGATLVVRRLADLAFD